MKGKLAAQFSGSSNDAPAPSRRGRVRSADFGMPERQGLLDLARTYLETQTRLWPDLVGTAAVPAADAATIAAMADDFERRFRQQSAEAFRPAGTLIAWIALAVAYLRFSDENSNPRSLDQQLLNVLNRARRDGVFVPWHYVLADAAVSGTLACRTGYTLAKTIGERRDEFGVSWFLIDDLSRMSRNTIESLRLGELAAETGVRFVGASDGFDSSNPQSSLLLPVLGSMNEAFVTQLKALVGDVVIETRQVEGQEKPQMIARFSINAVPALAVLERGMATDRDGPLVPVWLSIHTSPDAGMASAAGPIEAIVPLTYDRRAAARQLRKTSPKS
jgi:hypothetical protein